MLEAVVICSLKILFVWAAMQPGMILFPLRQWFEMVIAPLPSRLMLWVRKPLFACLFCMSSVWGIVFSFHRAAISFEYLGFLLAVGGLNYLIAASIAALVKDEDPTEL